MYSKGLKLLILLPLFFSFCLKAKRSPFDISKPSTTTTGLMAATGFRTTSSSSSSTTNNTTTSVAPSSMTYGGSGTYKMIPGNLVNYTPTTDVPVESWSIMPDLATLVPGLTFNTSTGSISGTPSTSLLSTGLPLTTFTITAKNGTATKDFMIQIQILKTGENVWTVIHGVSGQDTGGGIGSLFFHTTTNSLYSGGYTKGSLDGEANPFPSILSAFATKYDLDGNRQWTKIVPRSLGSFSQSGLSIDSSANVIISGSTDTGGGGTYDGISLTGSAHLGITKFDSNGVKLWSVVKPGTELTASGNFTDSSGNIYSAGTVKNNLDGVTNTGSTDAAAVIIKFNSSGVQQGLPTLVGNGVGAVGRHNGGTGVISDSAGNIWVSGLSMSTTTCATANNQRTVTLYKFNSSMTYLNCYSLASSASTDNSSDGVALTSDPSNNIYVTGYTTSNLDGLPKISSAVSGSNDAFIAKFSVTGTMLWRKQLAVPGNTSTVGYAIVRSSDDFYYITGRTNGNLNGEILNGTQDMFVAKYDNTGTLIWVKLFGSSGSTSEGTGLAFDTNNTLYASGTTNGDLGGVVNPVKPQNAHFLFRFVK